ncbi:MAG: hypothetical protein ACP5EP_11415 [Acidobacteriaceae bacterium]
MPKLTTEKRRKLPAKDFALGKGHYPIEDKAHARAALARISEFGTPEEKKEVEAKVHHKFPGMTIKANGEKKGRLRTKNVRRKARGRKR